MGYFGAEPAFLPLTEDQIAFAGDKRFAQLGFANVGPFLSDNMADNTRFAVNQRRATNYQTGVAGVTNGQLTYDRWHINDGGVTGARISVATEPDGTGFLSIHRLQGTGGCGVYQRLETNRWRHHALGRKVLVSLDVRSAGGPGNLVIEIPTVDNEDDFGNYTARGTVTVPAADAASVWKRITVPAIMPAGLTQAGLYFGIFCPDVTSTRVWHIRRIKMEVVENDYPNIGTPYMTVPYQQELVQCQRHLYDALQGHQYDRIGPVWCYTATANITFIQFPVELRTVPTAVFSAAAGFTIQTGAGSNIVCTSFTSHGLFPRRAAWGFNVASGQVAGDAGFVYNTDAAAYCRFHAEL